MRRVLLQGARMRSSALWLDKINMILSYNGVKLNNHITKWALHTDEQFVGKHTLWSGKSGRNTKSSRKDPHNSDFLWKNFGKFLMDFQKNSKLSEFVHFLVQLFRNLRWTSEHFLRLVQAHNKQFIDPISSCCIRVNKTLVYMQLSQSWAV